MSETVHTPEVYLCVPVERAKYHMEDKTVFVNIGDGGDAVRLILSAMDHEGRDVQIGCIQAFAVRKEESE
ncbi:MAG: hypothetical protein J5494_01560 [Candidatus Methanomethylophilaceae archaeon]|nr:hypothetical protein [Candidatus Methanomethylophilaceae archaeon]